MNDTKNPTALQSQKWIIQALLKLIQNTEYDKISVTEICRMAMLDRRTFYRNFSSKNDVLEQYIQQLSSEYIEEFQKINPLDKYNAAFLFFGFWKQHLCFIKNIQNYGLGDFVFNRFENFIKSYQQLLIGVDKVDLQTDYLLAYRIGGFWNVMMTWVANDANLPPEELASLIARQ